PRFTYDDQKRGGTSQGDGDPGDPTDGKGKPGRGKAGNEAGEHALEVDVTLDELADMLGAELELPDIQDKGKGKILDSKERYTGIRTVGPESLRHFRRTYREALKRQISSGQYAPDNPMVIPVPHDKRYRSGKPIPDPTVNAVAIYMMDISGSMGDEQKEIVRIESFWINTWLRKQYKGIESVFITHDSDAHEVDQETFFHTSTSGGTQISSAYKLCSQLIDDRF